jgi:hypothetical protein
LSSSWWRPLCAYVKVPLEAATATGPGDCGPAQLATNDTVYWYTRAVSDGPESLTVTVAPSFTGTIARIAFTPLVAGPNAAPSGQASPNPEEMVLTSTPPGSATPVSLSNPPTFEQVKVQVPHPADIRLRLVSTDPGAAPTTCAETAVVFYERKD